MARIFITGSADGLGQLAAKSLVEQGAIKPVIHSTFPAAEAAKAHELMESNQHIGKIVLTWS